MPIYEYICKKCDHEFELIISRSDKPECPECKSKSLDKQHSTFAASVKEGGSPKSSMPEPPCGSCGDPRGPGVCGMMN
ncbi:MAG: zinc ribbon domain-containing protein [Nitrospinaceae bacterium]